MYESLQIPPQATIISIEKQAPKFYIMEEPRNQRMNHRMSTFSNALSKTSNPLQYKSANYSSDLHRRLKFQRKKLQNYT